MWTFLLRFFLYYGICEIHTQKITFVNVLLPIKYDSFTYIRFYVSDAKLRIIFETAKEISQKMYFIFKKVR